MKCWFEAQGHWLGLMPIITLIRAEMVDSQPDSCTALRAPGTRLCTPAGLPGFIYLKNCV